MSGDDCTLGWASWLSLVCGQSDSRWTCGSEDPRPQYEDSSYFPYPCNFHPSHTKIRRHKKLCQSPGLRVFAARTISRRAGSLFCGGNSSTRPGREGAGELVAPPPAVRLRGPEKLCRLPGGTGDTPGSVVLPSHSSGWRRSTPITAAFPGASSGPPWANPAGHPGPAPDRHRGAAHHPTR